MTTEGEYLPPKATIQPAVLSTSYTQTRKSVMRRTYGFSRSFQATFLFISLICRKAAKSQTSVQEMTDRFAGTHANIFRLQLSGLMRNQSGGLGIDSEGLKVQQSYAI